ncbi:MAG: radical SAM protein [Candidatus Omnitrophica bacterium]|nr:radical SAM protein [Candidatus Omnitrophota bacterium]
MGSRSFLPISIIRGCLYKCHFCTVRNGINVRMRNFDSIMEEIGYAHRLYGIDNFQIVDDNFAVNREFVLGFCEKLMHLDFKVKWGAFHTRIECLDKEVIRAMDRAGCYYLTTGIETASQEALNDTGKRMDLGLVKERLRLIRDTSRIKVGGFFLVGLPGETKKDIFATLRLSRSLPLECIWFTIVRVEPGSQWYSSLKAKDGRAASFASLIRNNCLCPGMTFSFRQYQGFVRRAILRFYLRPRAIISFIRNLLDRRNRICVLNLPTIFSFLFSVDISKDSGYGVPARIKDESGKE